MNVRVVGSAVIVVVLCTAAPACAAGPLNILAYSQQDGNANASAGSRVTYVSGTQSGSGRQPVLNGTPGNAGSEGGSPPNPYPAISSTSPKLSNPHPEGPQSFWYTAEGHSCIYFPTSNGICYTVTTPAGSTEPPAPSVNPAALAEAAASRLALGPGRIQASPSASTAGLTGAASWFWIEPAPAARSLSVSLRGERVTVSASAASVRWSFGDSSELVAGPGVPYRPGSAPAGAVRHVYQTRCLPGDRGHDPYVLSSCGTDGYAVEALVKWAIGYMASGPISGGGALPSRSTATSVAYPVGEARAFLTTARGER